MSATPVVEERPPDVAVAGDTTTSGEPPAPGSEGGAERRHLDLRTVVLTCVAAFLSAGAAGWMTAGVFESGAARIVALVAAAVGSGLVLLSYRLRRPSAVQYASVPVAAVLGGAVVALDSGGTAELGRLVVDALFNGGLSQPPVPFDPGWRFVLTLVVTLLASGTASVALGFHRPKLAVALPVPLIIGAALVQPAGSETLSVVVAFVLGLASLTVAYGIDLAQSGVSSGRFEAMRLLRGAGALVALAAGLVLLANVATFLLPSVAEEQVIPPQRPPTAPPQPDRELFTVTADRRLPWRLGVLDVYEDGAWKTPPFDPKRLVDLPADADDLPDETGSTEETVTVTFAMSDIGGRVLPTLAVPHRITVEGGTGTVEYDPRTQALRLSELVDPGLLYTVTAAAPATAEELAAAPPPGPELAEFLEVPPAPQQVQELLAQAPDTNLFERLQFVRQAYYDQVIAAGAGNPVDVPPARVAEILDGVEATPYEITAAEALLARWAGVPSRLGFGYFGGDPAPDGSGFGLRPKHGATYLEVYFEGEGWVPIVGKPPRAQSSFTDAQKNEDPAVRPTDELALITYVPVRLTSLTLLFEVVRFYLAQIVPAVLGLVLLIAFYPGLLRALRRWRRSRWAGTHGVAGRIAVAYAELRDTAWDLNIGHPALTPLEFVGAVAHDPEHEELAWLVTRALWGDLARDLRTSDAEAAEEMARSVRRRIRGAQTGTTRVLAIASRASLKDAYSDELPNAWWRLDIRRRLGDAGRGVLRRIARRRPRIGWPRLRGATTNLPLIVVGAVLLTTGCAQPLDLRAPADPDVLPAVPAALDDLQIQREESAEVAFEEGGEEALVTAGQVYSIRRDDTIEASLQLGALRPGLAGRLDDVRRGILSSLGGGQFEPVRLGDERVHVLTSVEQRLILWFAPDGSYYQLLVARRAFDDADALLEAVLAFQRGDEVTGLRRIRRDEAPDPRRGFPL